MTTKICSTVGDLIDFITDYSLHRDTKFKQPIEFVLVGTVGPLAIQNAWIAPLKKVANELHDAVDKVVGEIEDLEDN